MSDNLQRVQLLIAQNRYDLAERELRGLLAQSPDHASAHSMLAVCLGEDKTRRQEATEEAERAIAIEPDESFHHYVSCQIWLQRGHHDRATAAIEEAIRLDPEDADYYAMLSQCRLFSQDYSEALDAANEALACDPENLAARNFLAISLERLGRGTESVSAAREAVSRDPDDSMTHATHGQALLHAGNHRDAQVAFRESLRLDPNNEFARNGMIHAINSRSFFFRLIYRFFVLMSRLNSKAAFGLIFGAWILVQVLTRVAQQIPALQVVVLPIVFLYGAFVLISWIAMPLFNTLLRFHPFGRHLLDRMQYWASNLIAACLAASLFCFVAWVWLGSFSSGVILGIYWLLMAIPVAAAFNMRTRQHRIGFGIAAMVVGVLPFWGVFQSMGPPVNPEAFSRCFRYCAYGVLGIQIASGLVSSRTQHS